MKKLNITRKQYNESKYFNKKYGALKYVSESGKYFKTSKGFVLALEGTAEPEPTDESLADIGNAIKKTGGEVVDKVKHGVKKAAQAIGDKFHGIYRKGDSVKVNGQAGEIEGKVVSAKPDEVVIKPNEKEREVIKEEDDEGSEDVTRGELTDMLKDVVDQVEKVCDSQDISFEEVVGVEKPEGESDEEADKDEVIATKEDVADALQKVISAVEKVADANDIELPDQEDDEEGAASDDKDEEQYDEGCDCGKPDCPECNPDGVQGECGGQACECGDPEKVLESRRQRAKLVREAIARRARARKVLESIRRRRAAKKVLESIRRRRAAKRIMESRRLRARRARFAK